MITPRLATIRFADNEDSGDAYDQTQYRDDIKMGDILVVPSEKVVGFLFSAWPCAVTQAHGAFHSKSPGVTWDALLAPQDGETYRKSYELAVETAQALGWDLDAD